MPIFNADAYDATSLGFWLPMGRTNFFNNAMDEDYIKNFDYGKTDATGHVHGYTIVDLPPLKGTPHPRLQTTALARLCAVLSCDLRPKVVFRADDTPEHRQNADNHKKASRRYHQVIPVFPRSRIGKEDSDPIGAMFICTDFQQGEEWQQVRNILQRLTLFVTVDGYYLWTALYNRGAHEETIIKAVKEHINLLCGGAYFSHFAEREGSREAASKIERELTLRDYRDENLGILTFFQLNTILEGMFNYNFDPRVFFDSGKTEILINGIKESYAIQEFIDEITTTIDFNPTQYGEVPKPASQPESLQALPTTPRIEQTPLPVAIEPRTLVSLFQPVFEIDSAHVQDEWLLALGHLGRQLLCRNARRDMLRQFLRKTSTITLQKQKWRIESCRRALLISMMQVTNRTQPIVQLEIPESSMPASQKRHSAMDIDQSSYMITGVTENQLRDYITLLSSKQPLVQNTWLFLKEALEALKDSTISEQPQAENAGSLTESPHESIRSLEHSWQSQMKSLHNNIQGLETALEQEYMEKMVDETEKIRAEQETLAEIERIKDRSDGASSQVDTTAISVIANIFALVGLILGLLYAAPEFSGISAFIGNTFNQDRQSVPLLIVFIVASIVGIIVFFIVFLIAYYVVHGVLEFIIRHLPKFYRQMKRHDERYYYELDIRIDADLTGQRAKEILTGDFLLQASKSNSASSETGNEPKNEAQPKIQLSDHYKPQRSSYRIERSHADESLHKVYLDIFVEWPRKSTRLWFRSRNRLRVFLVYEVLFHRPSDDHAYALKNLRVVSTSDFILTPEQIDDLKQLTGEIFVNSHIDRPEQQFTLDGERFDSLMSMHERQWTKPDDPDGSNIPDIPGIPNGQPIPPSTLKKVRSSSNNDQM